MGKLAAPPCLLLANIVHQLAPASALLTYYHRSGPRKVRGASREEIRTSSATVPRRFPPVHRLPLRPLGTLASLAKRIYFNHVPSSARNSQGKSETTRRLSRELS